MSVNVEGYSWLFRVHISISTIAFDLSRSERKRVFSNNSVVTQPFSPLLPHPSPLLK